MKKFAFVFIAVLTLLVLTGCPGTGQEPVVYALRDTGPAGGLIFYIDGADAFSWDYLEAAPVSTEWAGRWGSVVRSKMYRSNFLDRSIPYSC